MRKAVVVGGCGFIGSYVVRELSKNGYEVTVLDNLSTGKQSNIDSSVTFSKADIRNITEIEEHISDGDIVFHLAALTSVPGSIENPLAYHETNILGTINVFEAARRKKAKGIIFSSSAAVYGNQEGIMTEEYETHPENPYALQKQFGEHLGAQYGNLYNLPVISLRYFNVYGKGNHEEGSYAPVTARFLKARRENKPLPITGTGEQTRDFIHVEDVARANVLAIKLLDVCTSEIVNISSGVSTEIRTIAERIGGEKIFLPARKEIQHSSGSNQKASLLINFTPLIPFSQGLDQLLQP